MSDVTLADDDTNPILTDNRAIRGNALQCGNTSGAIWWPNLQLMQMVPSGGQFATNASGAIWWPNLQPMQVAPSSGQIWNWCKWRHLVVNCPTRWSLSFIFVFLCWSSSWRLGPHIEGGRLFWPLLKAGMTVLTQFFCKMYFLYVSRGRKNFLGEILWVLPLQKPFFSQPLGSSWVLQKLRIMRGLNSPRCKIKSIVITISNAWWSAIFEMIRNFWKTSHPTKKGLPDPQKKWKWGHKKILSSNPSWHVHFAKKQVQFGIFWPLE